MRDYLLRCSLILIARHRQPAASSLQLRQQGGNTVIGLGVIAVVLIIIRNKIRTCAQDVLLRPLVLRQRTADEVIDAVTHLSRIFRYRKSRIAQLLQRMIAGVTQIVYCVEQGAVQIEDIYHWVI